MSAVAPADSPLQLQRCFAQSTSHLLSFMPWSYATGMSWILWAPKGIGPETIGQNNYTGGNVLHEGSGRYEEQGALTVNSPDSGMLGAVKGYMAPFITAPRAQRGHKYPSNPHTLCSTNKFQRALSPSCAIYNSPTCASLSITDRLAFLQSVAAQFSY